MSTTWIFQVKGVRCRKATNYTSKPKTTSNSKSCECCGQHMFCSNKSDKLEETSHLQISNDFQLFHSITKQCAPCFLTFNFQYSFICTYFTVMFGCKHKIFSRSTNNLLFIVLISGNQNSLLSLHDHEQTLHFVLLKPIMNLTSKFAM